MPVRVLHVDSGRDWRGGQRQVFLLAEGLRASGYEPLVVAPPGSPLLHRLRAAGLAAAGVRMRGEWDLPAARRIRRLATTWRPDIVHAHDARAHALALAALLARETPLVVTRRVTFAPSSAGLKYGRRVARFIAISHAVRDAMVDGGIHPDRIAVVHSGVPIPTVTSARDWRAECGWPPDAVICGIVGAMSAEKGVELLGDVARRMPPDACALARLVFLGGRGEGRCTVGGMESYRAGFVDEVHAAMAGLDLLWHPARAEGLGTAVIDAMALGVPPIAFAVGGLPELIEHERNGILVTAGDTAGFARAVARLVVDRDARSHLAAAGPARAAGFGVGPMVDGTDGVYRSLLGPGTAEAGLNPSRPSG